MPSSLRNSRSDLESTAPTVVEDARPNIDPGAVDQVIAPGEEPPTDVRDEKGDPFLVQWNGPDDPANPKVRDSCFILSVDFKLPNGRTGVGLSDGISQFWVVLLYSMREFVCLLQRPVCSCDASVWPCRTFASSAPSGIEGQLIQEFNLSTIGVAHVLPAREFTNAFR
jgi:hypothetical protein